MPGRAPSTNDDMDKTHVLIQAILAKLDHLENMEGQLRDIDQQQRAHNAAINWLECGQCEIVPFGCGGDPVLQAREGPMGPTCFHKLEFPKVDG